MKDLEGVQNEECSSQFPTREISGNIYACRAFSCQSHPITTVQSTRSQLKPLQTGFWCQRFGVPVSHLLTGMGLTFHMLGHQEVSINSLLEVKRCPKTTGLGRCWCMEDMPPQKDPFLTTPGRFETARWRSRLGVDQRTPGRFSNRLGRCRCGLFDDSHCQRHSEYGSATWRLEVNGNARTHAYTHACSLKGNEIDLCNGHVNPLF